MNNFEIFKVAIEKYFSAYGVNTPYLSTLHDVSLNTDNNNYLYNGEYDLEVVSMDDVAKKAYKIIKNVSPKEHPVSTADAFLINKENEWYLIEFKDAVIRSDRQSTKDNVIKKAHENWHMLMDIFYSLMEMEDEIEIFDLKNPIKFAKTHVNYILVCSAEKNSNIYALVKNHTLVDKRYTPPFMQRLKDYLFKDVYVYTEEFFEWKFVKNFSY